jgi:hypothetical protein
MGGVCDSVIWLDERKKVLKFSLFLSYFAADKERNWLPFASDFLSQFIDKFAEFLDQWMIFLYDDESLVWEDKLVFLF